MNGQDNFFDQLICSTVVSFTHRHSFGSCIENRRRIFTKIESLHNIYQYTEVHWHPSWTFWDLLLTDEQTNQPSWNITFCRGGVTNAILCWSLCVEYLCLVTTNVAVQAQRLFSPLMETALTTESEGMDYLLKEIKCTHQGSQKLIGEYQVEMHSTL